MTEVYNSTATMAWPGQPETDFNAHVPMWEALQLPVGPEYARGKGLAQMLREQIEADANSNNNNSGGKSGDEGGDSAGHRADVQRQQQQQKGFIETMKAPTKKTTPRVVDWENFDFSGVGAAKDESPSHPPPTSASKPPQDELDKFFDSFGMSGSKASNSEGFLSVDGPGYNIDGDEDGETDSEVEEKQSLSSGFGLSRSVGGGGGGMAESVNYDDLSSEENASRRRALFQRTAVNGISSPDQVEPRFTTPANYLDQEEFKDHVGVEVWSNYRNQGFEEVDDVVWDDDVYTAQALRHLIAVTDEYLDDHSAAVEAHDEQKHWGRAMRNAFLGEDNQLEPIPEYLTPDKNRGIVYSDEIIEMKGKISLLPLQEEPEVEYKDDVFTHNKEFEVANKIGTIRVQYDWQPRTDLEHVIEEHKLPALQPVIDYINHAGKLVSTKVSTIPTRNSNLTDSQINHLRMYVPA